MVIGVQMMSSCESDGKRLDLPSGAPPQRKLKINFRTDFWREYFAKESIAIMVEKRGKSEKKTEDPPFHFDDSC